jgi:hypothetical protein
VKLPTIGAGLGRYALSPVALIATLALLTTAVAFAAAPAVSHGPKSPHPSATGTATASEASETPEAEIEADASPGACNALHGNAANVIPQLVANYASKHPGKKVPPGLKKVADRLTGCQAAAGSSAVPGSVATPAAVGDDGSGQGDDSGAEVGKHPSKGN